MEEKPEIGLGEVDKLNSIETARMALRWALERLHALEGAKAEAVERSTREAKWRAEAEDEVRSLKSSLTLKTAQADERQRYYQRIEEFLSLRLAGKVDIAALAQREAEVAQLRQDLEARVGQLEREFAARRQSLELEFQRLSRQAREAAQSGAKDAQAWVLKRQEEFEREHASKLVDAKERELRVAKQEAELAERQRRFDEFAAEQKARFDAEAKELQEQARTRLKSAERILEDRQGALEAGWTREKALLLQELALLRRKVQETAPALAEAERRLDESSGALAAAQQAERRAEARGRLAELDREAVSKRLEETSARLESEIAARAELESRAARAEADASGARSSLDAARLRLAQRERELSLEQEAFKFAELSKAAPEKLAVLRADFERRVTDLEETQARETVTLLRKLQEREESLAAAEIERERALDEQRLRLTAELTARQRAAAEEAAASERSHMGEAAAWRRRHDEAAARAADLEAKLAQALERARSEADRADAEAERNKALTEHGGRELGLWRREWETERGGLLAKLAELEEAARQAGVRADEQSHAADARADARRAELEEHHRAELIRLSEDRGAWEAACAREAHQWRGRAEEAARRTVELEAALEQAQSGLSRAQEQAHAEAALARERAAEADKRLSESRAL